MIGLCRGMNLSSATNMSAPSATRCSPSSMPENSIARNAKRCINSQSRLVADQEASQAQHMEFLSARTTVFLIICSTHTDLQSSLTAAALQLCGQQESRQEVGRGHVHIAKHLQQAAGYRVSTGYASGRQQRPRAGPAMHPASLGQGQMVLQAEKSRYQS